MKKTRFTAFYSYKGGVGRSLTLANLAYVLAFKGKKVLIIDMDLEAPGQHATDLFKDSYSNGLLKPKGIMELLGNYEYFRKELPETSNNSDLPQPFDWHLNDYLIRSTVFDKHITKNSEYTPSNNSSDKTQKTEYGSLWLLPATGKLGNQFNEYLTQLAKWNWDDFYEKSAGISFFEAFKVQLAQEGFDEVIIDSRTGFSDVFYTTTLLLADTVVCVSGLNRQNIEGTRRAIDSLINPNSTKFYGEKRILLVGSPVPTASMKGSDIKKREREISSEWKKFPGWAATIPYHPYLALREEVLSMDTDNPFTDSTQYTESIIQLYNTLEKKVKPNSFERFHENERINPFLSIRVEQWNVSEVVNHFVDPGNNIRFALEQFMPTVIFGSRGTGKTMLARWFSFETNAYRLEKNNQTPGTNTVKQIGLWFRLDIDLLNAFNCDEVGPRDTFNLLFGQFLDVLILRKALKALQCLGGLDSWLNSSQLYTMLAREMGRGKSINNYNEFETVIADRLWEIRAYINNPSKCELPFITQGNILMKVLVEQLSENTFFRKNGHYFAVFIDEYENFHAYQQQIVNTRLKQAKESDRVTYNLLARNCGIQTYDTLAKDRPIEDSRDFRSYNLDEGIGFDDFYTHIKKVVHKHLDASEYFSHYGYIEPEQLFATLPLDTEISLLAGNRGNYPLVTWVKKNYSAKTALPLLIWMDTEASLLRQAVAVILVNQGKKIETVVNTFKQDKKKAHDWYHNYHMGALFWLYSLYHKKKRYAGFRQIVGIAGNNTRVALDLCYAIIEKWLASDANRTLPISADIQSAAILTQSNTYFRRLVEKGHDVGQIHQFVQRLGRLFEIIHKGPKQSEPEINHFKIEGEIEPEVEAILHRCRADAVLRWLPGNKQKSRSDEQRNAWQLHPRYAPYFNISWRRKKGIMLNANDLKVLFFGDEKEWKRLVKDVEKRYLSIKKNNDNSGQRSLL